MDKKKRKEGYKGATIVISADVMLAKEMTACR